VEFVVLIRVFVCGMLVLGMMFGSAVVEVGLNGDCIIDEMLRSTINVIV